MQKGAVVRFRNRDWVLLPSDDPEVYRLRPLAGTDEEAVLVHQGIANLLRFSLSHEGISPSSFPLPDPEATGDSQGVRLLWNAARLLLRESASPLRCLGRISVTPRTYQLVPLMMALRLHPVRLLIADDVGVGKTVEAGLVVRELWDRREVRRVAVLCPPYLCDQWEKELREKFNLEPVVVRSDTVARLEQRKPSDRTLYQHFPVQVISIDFVKTHRNRHAFLLDPPECVVVDEAHGATPAGGQERQLRYELVRELAKDPSRHIILLTATPHSGIREAFQRLLGLLDPEFEQWDLASLSEEQRKRLSLHFVQRTRRDIQAVWEEGQSLFPKRAPQEAVYSLSPRYRDLLARTYNFCKGIVERGGRLEERKRRMVWWGALSLLRSVASSPRSAKVALGRRRTGEGAEGEEEDLDLPQVYEPTDRYPSDEVPTPALARPGAGRDPAETQALRELERLAESLTPEEDGKLRRATELVRGLLREGYSPVVWCFFVDTAEYVADRLREALAPEFPDLVVLSVTGRIGEEERREQVQELMRREGRRVLVATDCLSEGINLQEGFDAVLHYDLPWNPNRLEQREGRVDRYGQRRSPVKVIRFYGQDNPVDGAVLEVLLRKAEHIRKDLGVHVPVPQDDERVVEAIVQHLFFRGKPAFQLPLFSPVEALHREWEMDARREKESRTRFAQHALRPEEVRRELEEVDRVLGDPNAVRDFVLQVLQRLGIPYRQERRHPDVFHIPLAPSDLVNAPAPVREALERLGGGKGRWTFTFTGPVPVEGAEFLGRNHPFVEALARYLFERALAGQEGHVVARAGAMTSPAVRARTVLLLLRTRYEVTYPGASPLLAEEVLTTGWEGTPEGPWLSFERALSLLSCEPGPPLPMERRKALVEEALRQVRDLLDSQGKPLGRVVTRRARHLEEAHRRVRKGLRERVQGLRVEPYWPPDPLALLVLEPAGEVRG